MLSSQIRLPDEENVVTALMNHLPPSKTIGFPLKTPGRKASGISKTPAATKSRRAFGDISNRKIKLDAPGKTPAAADPKQPLPTKSVKFEVAQNSTKKSAIKQQRRVEFILPDKIKEQTQVEPKQDLQEDDDEWTEVELPAGRMWSEQLDWDDYHHEEEESSLVVEFEKDKIDYFRERREAKLRAAEDELDNDLVRIERDVWETINRDGAFKKALTRAMHHLTTLVCLFVCLFVCYSRRFFGRSCD